MKRLVCIIAILFTAGCIALAETPPKLTFSDTRVIPGISKKELEHNVYLWCESKNDNRQFSTEFDNDTGFFLRVLFCPAYNSPNFGTKLLDGTIMSVDFLFVCRDGSYTAKATNIEVCYNPGLGTLYGEYGHLFADLYTKRQIKMSRPIINYIAGVADEIFAEFAQFIKAK